MTQSDEAKVLYYVCQAAMIKVFDKAFCCCGLFSFCVTRIPYKPNARFERNQIYEYRYQ